MMQAQDFPLISHSPKRWAEFVRTRTPILESIVPLNARGQRNWGGMGNETLLAHARWKIHDEKIGGREELRRVDRGLGSALKRRNLLDAVGLGDYRGKRRDWAGMREDMLVAHAKKVIAETGLAKRGELAKADRQLYQALWRRGLLEKVGLGESKEKLRNWANVGKDEIIALARAFISERGIRGRRALWKSDRGLYAILRRNKLLEDVGLPNLREKMRNWAVLDHAALVKHALGFIAERGIDSRKKLMDADSGLYQVLKKRKLLDSVFAKIETSNHKAAVDGVISALDSFGDSK